MSAGRKLALCSLAALALAPARAASPLRARAQSPSPTQAKTTAQGQSQAPSSTSQAAPPASGTLVAATASGSKTFTSDQILAAAGLKIGDTVTRQDFQLAADRLAATGLFSDIRYRFSSQGRNVTAEFQVADARTVPVSFDNFPWFTDEQLDDSIRQAVGIFDGTAPESGKYDDAIGAAIEKQLETLRIPGHVVYRLVERPAGTGMELQYQLAGPTLDVASVQFSDPLAEHDERVLLRLQDVVGKPFSRYFINVFVNEQVRPVYLSQGYLRVRFSPPEARFTGNPNLAAPSRVLVIIPITTGPRYIWAGAKWSGNSIFDAEALDAMLHLSRDAAADGLAIEAGFDKVREAYGSKGYLDVTLDEQPVYDDSQGSVAYNVKISEGPRYTMGNLVISGLSVEAERQVRGAWRIAPGQAFDLTYFHAFVDDIAREALGDLPVHFQRIGRLLDRHPESRVVNVMLDFE